MKSRDVSYWAFLIAGFSLLLTAYKWTGGLDSVMASNENGRAKAQSLVAAYAKHVGANDAAHQTLDLQNDRSFGSFGFHYFPNRNVIQARVYIVRSDEKANAEDRPNQPELVIAEKKVDMGLNDPRFGGMYDRGGGYFFLDEQKQATFLAKDYPLSPTDVTHFIKDVDNLNALGGIWVTSWFGHVADQVHGHEPPPTHFVTRENDPYKRQ